MFNKQTNKQTNRQIGDSSIDKLWLNNYSDDIGDVRLYSSLGLHIRKRLHTIIKKIIKSVLPYNIVVESEPLDNMAPLILASSHHDNLDFLISIVVSQFFFINLVNAKMKMIFRAPIELNGAVYVDRDNRGSRHSAKRKLIQYLQKGYSINLYPEGVYNLSPNKLNLPFHRGIVDIAKKTGAPILPIHHEYDYGYDTKGRYKLKNIFVKTGKLIYVDEKDTIEEKFREYEESMATLCWEMLEKKTAFYKESGIYGRDEILEQEYCDFIELKVNQIHNAGSSIELETRSIWGSESEFYNYFPINHVNL